MTLVVCLGSLSRSNMKLAHLPDCTCQVPKSLCTVMRDFILTFEFHYIAFLFFILSKNALKCHIYIIIHVECDIYVLYINITILV